MNTSQRLATNAIFMVGYALGMMMGFRGSHLRPLIDILYPGQILCTQFWKQRYKPRNYVPWSINLVRPFPSPSPSPSSPSLLTFSLPLPLLDILRSKHNPNPNNPVLPNPRKQTSRRRKSSSWHNRIRRIWLCRESG
jgi:hypothetical protein